LAQLDTAARTIAEGELATPVTVRGRDEISVLARALDTMRVEIATARKELEARVAQRTRELDAAFELSQAMVTELELDTLLHSVAERARTLTHARTATLCLLEPETDLLVLKASSGSQIAARETRQSAARPLARQVLNGATVLQDAACASCDLLRAHAPGNCAVAPLRTGKQSLGALCVIRDTTEPFGSEATRALTLLANAGAVAIRNARLIAAGKQQAERHAALAEREQLAAELHDNLAQTLGFLSLKIGYARELLAAGRVTESSAELEQARRASASAYEQVRAALVGLRESPANSDDLCQRLTEDLKEFRQGDAPRVEWQLDASALRLTPLVQTQVVRIVHEALINARRHAHAGFISVSAARQNGDALVRIEDDGCGFDPAAQPGEHHLGLAVMRMRAERCGGRLDIESAPGKGTRISARFPLGE
jgi:two-component system nitrate/nitrite sensor histidine kinase NarX